MKSKQPRERSKSESVLAKQDSCDSRQFQIQILLHQDNAKSNWIGLSKLFAGFAQDEINEVDFQANRTRSWKESRLRVVFVLSSLSQQDKLVRATGRHARAAMFVFCLICRFWRRDWLGTLHNKQQLWDKSNSVDLFSHYTCDQWNVLRFCGFWQISHLSLHGIQ